MSQPDSNSDEAAPPKEKIFLRAVSQPTNRLAWGFIGFMATFGIDAGIDFMLHGEQTLQSTFGLPVAIVAGIAVASWPRPLFLKELQMSPEGIQARTSYGVPLNIPASTIDIISVEGQFDLATQSYEPWGRLHIRAGKTWLAIQVSPVGIKGTFAQVMDLLPEGLGITGDHELIVPAISDLSSAAEWVKRVDRQARRELGRQFRYLIFYGALTGAAGIATALYACLAHSLPAMLGRKACVSCGALLFLAAGAFLTAAWRRWKFMIRVRAQINSIKTA